MPILHLASQLVIPAHHPHTHTYTDTQRSQESMGRLKRDEADLRHHGHQLSNYYLTTEETELKEIKLFV